jgi:short-subunit dehydrogenase
MHIPLKPVEQQTVVVTGASSGIGLTTARKAAARGARVVLVARSEQDLQRLEDELNAAGAQSVAVPADVADRAAMNRVVRVATSRFGGFDTWVNNAGVSIYGRLLDAEDADNRRLFETDFWGVVYGCLEAVEHLRSRGGAIVNVGSALSERAVPLQGMYSAAKHAVRGFTDALRMELEKDELPVSLTLITPASIDTPFTRHAKNNMQQEPALAPPVYAPEEVAEAILYAASHPVRDLPVGSMSRQVSVMGRIAPRMLDRYMERRMFARQMGGPPLRDREGALHLPGGGLQQRGGTRPQGRTRASLYTRLLTSRWVGRTVVAATGAALVGLVAARARAHA